MGGLANTVGLLLVAGSVGYVVLDSRARKQEAAPPRRLVDGLQPTDPYATQVQAQLAAMQGYIAGLGDVVGGAFGGAAGGFIANTERGGIRAFARSPVSDAELDESMRNSIRLARGSGRIVGTQVAGGGGAIAGSGLVAAINEVRFSAEDTAAAYAEHPAANRIGVFNPNNIVGFVGDVVGAGAGAGARVLRAGGDKFGENGRAIEGQLAAVGQAKDQLLSGAAGAATQAVAGWRWPWDSA